MKRNISILSLLLLSTILIAQEQPNKDLQEPTEEQKQAIFMMNYAQYVTYKLMKYNNILVLEDEYNNLNNNMNYETIKDYSSIDIINYLLDSLYSEMTNHKNIERLKKTTEQKMNNALYNSIPKVNTVFTGGVTPLMIAINTAQVAGSAFMSYQQCKNQISQEFDDSMFEYQKISNDILHQQYVNLNTYTYNLVQDYAIPDEWRINSIELEDIMSFAKDQNKQRAYINLQNLSNSRYIQHFPMYWYHLGKAAYEAGDELGAIKYINRFEKENIEIFRYDTIAIDAYKCKITILCNQYLNSKYRESSNIPQVQKNELYKNQNLVLNEIKAKLEFIEKNKLPKNWSDYYFCALVYAQIGDVTNAKRILEKNISELSTKVENQFLDSAFLDDLIKKSEKYTIYTIGDSYYDGLELSRALLTQLGYETISFSSIENQYKSDTQCLNEVFYQFGLTPTSEVIKNSKEEIRNVLISTKISSKDKLRIDVKLPMQWMLSSNTELKVKLIKETETKNMTEKNKNEQLFNKKENNNDKNIITLNIDEKAMKKVSKEKKQEKILCYTSNKWKCDWAKEGYAHLSLIISHPVYSIELLYPIEIDKAGKNVSPNAIRFDGIEYAL